MLKWQLEGAKSYKKSKMTYGSVELVLEDCFNRYILSVICSSSKKISEEVSVLH